MSELTVSVFRNALFKFIRVETDHTVVESSLMDDDEARDSALNLIEASIELLPAGHEAEDLLAKASDAIRESDEHD